MQTQGIPRSMIQASNVQQRNVAGQTAGPCLRAPSAVQAFSSRPARSARRGSLVVTSAKLFQQNQQKVKDLRNSQKNSQKSPKQDRNPKRDRNGPIDEAAGSANSYLFLAGLNALAALPLAVAPHTAADFLFGASAQPHTFLHEPLLRILATGFAGASTAAASLNLAAKKGRLGESSFQRLNLALLFASGFNAILFLQNAATGDESSVINFSAFYVTFLALGATVWTAWGGYGKNSETGLSLKRVGPMPAFKKYQDDLAEIPSQSGLQSTLYTGLTVALVATGAAYLLQPQETLTAFFNQSNGYENTFIWRAVGGGLVTLLPAMTYTLKEGAQLGKLGEAPYKALNIGIFGAGAGHIAILTPLLLSGSGGPFLPALLGIWGLGSAVSGVNLFKNGDA